MSNNNKEILAAFHKIQLASANEASTRLKLINRILREVLDWTDDDIDPEVHVSEDGKTTYADYILRTANTALVVEAKKIGATFELPKTQRRVKLNSSFVSGEVGAAIIQARDYARKLGIDFAAVTNGNAWIIFPAQRHDQVTFQDCYALVFPSLESILKDDFQEFQDVISRPSVINGNLDITLCGRPENQFGNKKLGHAFTSHTKALNRNPVYPLIEEAVVIAFSDSIGELESSLFEKCYVTTPETLKFDSRVNLHIAKRSHLFGTQPARPMKPSDSNILKLKLAKSAAEVKPVAVLILGSVGAGKTTFIQYIRKVKAAELFSKSRGNKRPHWIYIDFRDCTSEESAVEFIYSHLKDYINEDEVLSDHHQCIKRAYEKEINALKKGPMFLISHNKERFEEEVTKIIIDDYKKITPYVDKIISFVGKEAAIFLVIDNVDQFEDEETQSRLFKETITLGHKLGINLIMSMRGSTYAKHRNSPTFDAFDFDPLQIDPPKISSVLSKRFALTRQLLEGKKGTFVAENGATIKLENVAQIIELVQASVLGTEIGNRIEVLATEDVRLALRMTREFLEFGYSNPGRALEVYSKSGKYVLPKHEAFRAILLGNRNVYSEEYSPIGNPFDTKLSINSAQLLRLYILAAVVNYSTSATFRHIDGTAITENLRKIGFGDGVTFKVLNDLCKYRFMHTASQSSPDVHSSFIPTRLGGYIVRDLVAYFPFLENVMFDTFISDNAIWEQLRSFSQTIENERDAYKRVKVRVQRVQAFVAYLEKMYLPLQIESQRRGLAPEWCSNPFADTKAVLGAELEKVERSANRNYGPNGRNRNSDNRLDDIEEE